MRHHKQLVTRFMIAALLAGPLTVAACSTNHDRVHDTYDGGYYRGFSFSPLHPQTREQ
jgi:hypothetical protein